MKSILICGPPEIANENVLTGSDGDRVYTVGSEIMGIIRRTLVKAYLYLKQIGAHIIMWYRLSEGNVLIISRDKYK